MPRSASIYSHARHRLSRPGAGRWRPRVHRRAFIIDGRLYVSTPDGVAEGA